ncbi:hypothetical protein [Brevibacillus brevis]|uniref:hypothetical protein n=1 Tax=Brevibacillus brevis TaxID=1393 RepID=UPI0011599CFC|nr:MULTISPECIES: hypothetical protein [Bacillales]TQR31607.1 hypothetical protein C7Y45_24155 [Lysinibacillus sp. SDF0063]WJQ82691.1 hypothetical protein QN310_05950 [Brevibacillus brevis]
MTLRQTYLENLQQRLDVQAVLVLNDSDMLVPFREGIFYFVVVNEPQADGKIRRMLFQEQVIIEQQISTWQLEKGAICGLDERLAEMLRRAEIVWDKEHYMKQMKLRLASLSSSLQKKHICKEYSQILRFFHETKEFLQQGMMLDAHHSAIQTIHYLARLIVYEAGDHPQPALWTQVKQIDPSIYKLYEELSFNAEALEKRIELLVLAIEFWIASRTKESVRYLVELMETKSGPWRLEELMNHPMIQEAEIEIPLVIDKMLQRLLIQEIVCKDGEKGDRETGFILMG